MIVTFRFYSFALDAEFEATRRFSSLAAAEAHARNTGWEIAKVVRLRGSRA